MNMPKNSPNTISDSGVLKRGDGYERVVTFDGWHPTKPDWLAQVRIRVDRIPYDSYAKAYVWTKDAGWQVMVVENPDDFWSWTPGFERWASPDTEKATWKIFTLTSDQLVLVASAA